MSRLVGQKIAHVRRQRNISQSALAHVLGMAKQAHISNVEAGRREPSLEFIVRSAEVLGVSLEYLLRDSIPIEAVRLVSEGISPSQEVMRCFRAKLKYQREQRGWSQSQLSREMGTITQAQISRLEAGHKLPSVELVLHCTDLFGTSVDYWLRDSIPLTGEG